MHKQGSIDREDMLELTRRMTLSRNCFFRIAGAYYDEDGFVDGTFNRHFGKLTPGEQSDNLKIAKTIPFSKTNEQLVQYTFDKGEMTPGSLFAMLSTLTACELKNDALLDVFYDYISEVHAPGRPFALDVFYGSFDIPRKGTDKKEQWESEEVYSFIICAFCDVDRDYNQSLPYAGFLYPAYSDHAPDPESMQIYSRDGAQQQKLF